MTEQRTNWAGNYTYQAARYHYPETIEQLQEIVSRTTTLKALGSTHSFNDIADTTQDMISLARLNQKAILNKGRRTATIGANLKYGEIWGMLHMNGLALHNMASLPHISIVGACATATHGSGEKNGSLATAVSAIEMVRADGELVTLSREASGEEFLGAVVSLGALGIVTRITLDLVPVFFMRQYVYEHLPLAQLLEHFDEIQAAAYSVSLFTDWKGDSINQVWLKRQVWDDAPVEVEPELFGATLATVKLHPIKSMSPEACTEQLGEVGEWFSLLPHFKMDFTPSSGEELQTEYLVPRPQALATIEALNNLREQIAPLLQISEIRTIAADDLWMSPFYQQARVALHFTWKKDWEAVRRLLPVIEERLAPFGAVPHWGKLFTMPAAQVQTQYPKLADFQRLLQKYDPQGKFRNAFLDKYIYTNGLNQ